MYKGLVASIVIVFFLSSIAFSDIGQAESFQISTENLLSLFGGPGSAIGSNSMIVGQSQVAATPGLDFDVALQAELGIINQGASAVSLSAILGSAQAAGLAGQQTQTDEEGLMEQEQKWAANLGQDVKKNDGIGSIIAGQGIVIGQIQIIANRNGISGDANISGAAQLDGIVGGPGLDIILKEFVAVGTGQ